MDVWVQERKIRDEQEIGSFHVRLLCEGRFICCLSLGNSLGICASLFSWQHALALSKNEAVIHVHAPSSPNNHEDTASSHPSAALCLRLQQGDDRDQHPGSLQLFLEEHSDK